MTGSELHGGLNVVGGPWRISAQTNVINHESAGNFQFDRVYEASSTNADVFEQSVEELISRVVSGYNATVFAYGTTGSGKTFTMQGSEHDPGVIPRSVHRLFELLEARGAPAVVRLSYFEIYNERVYDLLSPDSKPTEVLLRDGSGGDTRIVGQREVDARDAQELLSWVANGDQLRRTSSTQYNEHSSRSHAVVRVHVASNSLQSTLFLCDLAGSERALVHSERRKEGAYINKSLLTLSTVISILSQGGGGHVPYRDSKLTRLLQPSLSGTALVSMLCTIQTGPPPAGGAETVNSVRFAAKAKNITVLAKRNSALDEAFFSGNPSQSKMVEQLQNDLESLRRELSKANGEREDLQEKLALLEATEVNNPEASLEAMSGISFTDENGKEDLFPLPPFSSQGQGEEFESMQLLRKELAWYKEENNKLHRRVSHLVSEISALDANIANLENLDSSESSPSTAASSTGSSAGSTLHTGATQGSLQNQVSELREQLKDRDMLIECLTGINNARSKFLQGSDSSRDTKDQATLAIQDLRI